MRFNIGQAASEVIIKVHQERVSPILNQKGIKCRFYPTCSDYALLAIEKYGLIRGWVKALKRIKRCRPDNYGSCIDFP